MNNGWSEHHRELHMNEIGKLQSKLDDLKRELGRVKTVARAGSGVKAVARVTGASMEKMHKRAAKTFQHVVGRLETPNAQRPTPNAELEEEEAQIGGS